MASSLQAATLAEYDCSPSPDNTACFSRALEAFRRSTDSELVIPAGIYRLSAAQGQPHLRIENFKGKRIRGANARIVFSDPGSRGMVITQSSDLTIEGLTLEWDPLPYVMGAVGSVDVHRGVIDIRPAQFSGKPSVEHVNRAPVRWASFHTPDGQRVFGPLRQVLPVDRIEDGGKAHYAVKVPPAQLRKRTEIKAGLNMVIVGRVGIAHAITVDRSKKLTLRHITITSSPGMGILVQPNCEDVSIIDNTIRPPGERRPLSTNADGIHVIAPLGALLIRGNVLDRLQDDAVVVARRGQWVDVRKERLVVDEIETTVGFRPGDELRALMNNRGMTTLGKIARVPSGTEREITIAPGTRTRPSDGRLAVFGYPEAPTKVLVTENVISNSRGIGVRLNVDNVEVVNNKISNVVYSAIRAGALLVKIYLPQAPVSDTVIANNDITQPALTDASQYDEAVIDIGVQPRLYERQFGVTQRNIVLRDNRLSGGLGYASSPIRVGADAHVKQE